MKPKTGCRWEDYRGTPSITLETDALKVNYLPLGGRMVSFLDKRTKREYLLQRSPSTDGPDSAREGNQRYTARYDDYVAGFDDMFPTIDECFYPSFPWYGHRIPDHGEVWSLEWECEASDDCLHMEVNGVRLPYKLSKDIRFTGNNELRVDYRIENPTDFDLEFLWTAHPTLPIEQGARIIVPPECTQAVCVVSKTGRIGSYGDLISWPVQVGKNGKKIRLDILGSEAAEDEEKYYFTDRLKRGWCGIEFPSDKSTFLLTFPVDRVPYLGIYTGGGELSNPKVVIPEPCTAPFDRLDLSRFYTQDSVVRKRGIYEWSLGMCSLREGETWKKHGFRNRCHAEDHV